MSTGWVPLAPRYRAVASLLATGASNVEISDALHLAVRTVEGYVSELKLLAGVPDRGRLILWCREIEPASASPEEPLPPE